MVPQIICNIGGLDLRLTITLLVAVGLCQAKTGRFDTSKNEILVDVTEDLGGSKEPFPHRLKAHFRLEGLPVDLDLERNDDVTLDFPVFFMGKGNILQETNASKTEEVAYYQDMKTGASLSVETKKTISGNVVHTLEGLFAVGQKEYKIRPSRVDQLNFEDGEQETGSKESIRTIPHKVSRNTEHGKQGSKKSAWSDSIAPTAFKLGPLEEDLLQRMQEDSAAPQRDKRDTSTSDQVANYHVEMDIILDHTFWEYWLKESQNDEDTTLTNIKKYVAYQLNGVDLVYKTIDPDVWLFKIRVFLNKLFIIKSASENPLTTGDSLSGDTSGDPKTVTLLSIRTLQKLSEWSVDAGRSWYSPDHTQLWTRYNLNGNTIVGQAPVSGMCLPQLSIALVEDTGFNTWFTSAHELGHVLGAAHDGQLNSCSSSDMYLMRSIGNILTQSTLPNFWKFSECSIRYFKNLLDGQADGYPRVCLTNRACRHKEALPEPDVAPGHKFDLDTQCALRFGDDHGDACESLSGDLCRVLYCLKPPDNSGTRFCTAFSPGAANGTSCGQNKYCQRGYCVGDGTSVTGQNGIQSDTNAAQCVVSDLPREVPTSYSCYDRSWFYRYIYVIGQIYNFTGRAYCNQIPERAPNLCFTSSTVKTYCCESCHRAGLVPATQHLETQAIVGPEWGEWSAWGECSATCGPGTQTRTRSCSTGSGCSGSSQDTRECSRGACMVHGGWTAWSDWSSCSVDCGTGIQERRRTCTNPAPSGGGSDCGGLSWEPRSCQAKSCAVNGGWSVWSLWGTCSRTCSLGYQRRSRTCTNPPPSDGGLTCGGNALQTRSCKQSDCPVNGQWSAWAAWASCSKTCDLGIRRRTRQCNNPAPSNGGSQCSGFSTEFSSCNEGTCDLSVWSVWSAWGSCSQTCGGGIQRRTRTCDGGSSCSGSSQQSTSCNTNKCPVRINGGWSSWGNWGTCSVSCGGGTRSRYRQCDNPAPANGGQACPGTSYDRNACNAQGCPVAECLDRNTGCAYYASLGDCTSDRWDWWMELYCPSTCGLCQGQGADPYWSGWGEWSDCSVTCGEGTHTRSRECIKPLGSSRHCEGSSEETDSCVKDACPACQDNHRFCEAWSEHGFCAETSKYKTFMHKTCKISCQLC